MRISFSPQRRDDSLSVQKQGDVLTINGELFDFSGLPDGGTIPVGMVPCPWIIGPVERVDGAIQLTLILPHGANPEQHVAFPAPVTVVEDGAVPIPFSEAPTEEPAHVDG